MAEWSSKPFSALLREPVRNGVYKPKEFHGRGAKIVNMGELFAHPRLQAIAMKRVELTGSELSRFSLSSGDLIFARRSLTAEGAGKCSIVLNVDGDTTFESSIIRARPDPTKASSLYLYYFFNSPSGYNCLDTIRRQVAVAGITGSDLSNLKIPIPPLNEQIRIAEILGTLDDKIELNRRMNETLEAMACAIFKDWFIDFGPTRAKADGRLSYLAPDVWGAFPARLDDEGKPDGWHHLKLSDIANQAKGSVDPSSSPEETFAHYSLPAFDAGQSPALDVGAMIKSNKTPVPANSVLLSKLNPEISRVWIPEPSPALRQISSTEFLVFQPRGNASVPFLFGLMRSSPFKSMLEGMVTGTSKSHQRISPPTLLLQPVAIAGERAMAAYTALVDPLLKRVLANRIESRTLAATRNLLLPKLMSREFCAPEAEKMVEAAA